MKILRFVLLFGLIMLAGCASNLMQPAPEQKATTPNGDSAQLIFLRPSFYGAAINASLYDVTTESIEFVGILSSSKKIAYQSPPGKRTFMVVSEAADFMHAELLPGKTYYAIVTPRMGAWKARFSLWPIKKDEKSNYVLHSDEFSSWVKDAELVSNTDASRAWFTQNLDSVKRKQLEYWPVWQQKSPKDIAERTLVPVDGI